MASKTPSTNQILPDASFYFAIDQEPEIVMIENYRSGISRKLFMSIPEI